MKVGGQILWNVTPICETSQIYYLMGRRPMKDVLGNHLKDLLFHLVQWLSTTLYCEGSVTNPSIWKESFTWIVLRIRSVRGWNLERWRTDRRLWWVGNDGRIGNLLEKTQCERCDISQTRRIYFSNRGWTNQNLEEIRNWEHPPWYGIDQVEERVTLTFLEKMNDFRSMSGSFICRHHVEPRVKLYSPREESFPIPLKCIDVSRITHTNLDVSALMIIGTLMALETSLILGQVSHNLLYWKKNFLTDICGPGGD